MSSTERGVCFTCGRLVNRAPLTGEWVHSESLGRLRVSQTEHAAVMADPIPAGHKVLHRETVLHQPEPDMLIGTTRA